MFYKQSLVSFSESNFLESWGDVLGKIHKFETFLPVSTYQKSMFSAFFIVFHEFSFIFS